MLLLSQPNVTKGTVSEQVGDEKYGNTSYQVQIGMKRSTELHVLHKISSLAFIWGDHSHLLRLDSCTQEPCGNLLHICSFSPENIANGSA